MIQPPLRPPESTDIDPAVHTDPIPVPWLDYDHRAEPSGPWAAVPSNWVWKHELAEFGCPLRVELDLEARIGRVWLPLVEEVETPTDSETSFLIGPPVYPAPADLPVEEGLYDATGPIVLWF